eukprot:9492893-Pyramimonas_sp.AAC.1
MVVSRGAVEYCCKRELDCSVGRSRAATKDSTSDPNMWGKHTQWTGQVVRFDGGHRDPVRGSVLCRGRGPRRLQPGDDG